MKAWMMWWGGPSYAPPALRDVEEFPSLRDLKAEFRRRAFGADPYYPCVQDSEAMVFFSDPREVDRDPYPDRLLKANDRRETVRVERC